MTDPPPIRVTRTDLALIGQTLRQTALYLWHRPAGYGWHKAADLVSIADRLDPENRNEEMSAKGKAINSLCDLFVAANSRIGEMEQAKAADAQTIADLKAQLAAATAEDPEDVAADARVAELIAAPVAADPAAPVVPPAAPAALTLDPAGATTFTVTPAATTTATK